MLYLGLLYIARAMCFVLVFMGLVRTNGTQPKYYISDYFSMETKNINTFDADKFLGIKWY